MNSDIKTQLNKAKELYGSKKYQVSLELFEELYNQNKEAFTRNDLSSYSWAIVCIGGL